MVTTVPQWPYLVETDGSVLLLSPEHPGGDAPVGDYCGEWGSHLDEKGQAVGVRLMFLSCDFLRDSGFVRATNVRMDDGDLIIFLYDSRLPDIEGMPFLPVYRAVRADGREILELSGYERA